MFQHTLFDHYRALSKKKRYGIIIGFVIVIVIGIVLWRAAGSSVLDEITREPQIRVVSTEQVAALSTETTPLSLIGTIRSANEANLRTESTGIVTNVYRKVGDFVFAGAIIAEIKNDAERASVAQARAQLDKTTKGSRDEELTVLEITRDDARKSLSSERRQAVNIILSAFAKAEDAVIRTSDQLMSNPDTTNPSFIVTTSEAQLELDIENDRVQLQERLAEMKTRRNALSTQSDLNETFTFAIDELDFITSYLDTITSALNKAIPTDTVTQSDISGYRSDIATARSGILTTLDTLSQGEQALESAQNTLRIAEENYNQGVSGGRVEDIAAAEAALRVAEANLEKTLIRTPISGRIASLSLSTGDFVSQFDPAAVVTNQNALEIVSFITEDERNNIAVNNEVVIDGTYRGVVTSIAPGLDPQTKKIEVRVGITDTSVTIPNGSSVEIQIARSRPATAEEVETIFIPLSALKVQVDDALVFTVSEENRLIPHTVALGRILGNKVEITGGISSSDYIVTDARGLIAEQVVTVR